MQAPFPFSQAIAPAPAAPTTVEHAGQVEKTDLAFEQLYGIAFPKIYSFIRCQVSSVETAQEIVGRIFLKAYRHRNKTPATESGMLQWIFCIAHTTLIDYWRVDKKRESVNLPLEEIAELAGEADDPERAYERKQRSADIVRVMNQLSDGDRTLMALKFAAQRTNREIARILGVSEGAVSMRLLRALRGLRQQLEDIGWP